MCAGKRDSFLISLSWRSKLCLEDEEISQNLWRSFLTLMHFCSTSESHKEDKTCRLSECLQINSLTARTRNIHINWSHTGYTLLWLTTTVNQYCGWTTDSSEKYRICVFAGFTLILFDGIKIETRRIKSGNRPVQSLYSFTDVQSLTDSCF